MNILSITEAYWKPKSVLEKIWYAVLRRKQ